MFLGSYKRFLRKRMGAEQPKKQDKPKLGILNRLLVRYLCLEDEYMKSLTSRIINHSIVWVYLTYVLAWFNKTQIAETLGTAIVVNIIGNVILYAGKSIVENLSKHNNWPDKDSSHQESTPSICTDDLPQPHAPGQPFQDTQNVIIVTNKNNQSGSSIPKI